MTAIIGLTGYAQHGKDSVGERLVKKHGYTRFAFADVLKSMALVLNPLVPLHPVQEDDTFTYQFGRMKNIVRDWGWEGAKQLPEVRRFLQVLGTEAVRDHLGQNAWVDATRLAIRDSGTDRAVITDARFPNEFEFVKMYGRLVKVERYSHIDRETGAAVLWDNGVGTTHPSEQFIATAPADFTIGALTGDMEGLLEEADLIVATTELKSVRS